MKIQLRKKTYQSLQDLQEDLDQFLEFYHDQRAHQGYRVKGRTPMKALEDYLNPQREEVKRAARGAKPIGGVHGSSTKDKLCHQR